MTHLYVNNGTSWQEPAGTYIKEGGIWVPAKKVWVKQGGVWSQVTPTPGSATFTASGSFQVPRGVHTLNFSGIGGGGSAGNVVDGGRNDDYGGSGGGASGQKIYNYAITVTPLETISVVIGGGGSRAYGGRDSNNQGGTGGTTYFYASGVYYYLLGGGGGYGGVGDAGRTFAGGSTSTSNSSFVGVIVTNGQNAQYGVGGYGGAGYSGGNTPGGTYGGGNSIHNELNGYSYGGGGAGGWSWYIREDNGNSPCWGGLGTSGYAYFEWS